MTGMPTPTSLPSELSSLMCTGLPVTGGAFAVELVRRTARSTRPALRRPAGGVVTGGRVAQGHAAGNQQDHGRGRGQRREQADAPAATVRHDGRRQLVSELVGEPASVQETRGRRHRTVGHLGPGLRVEGTGEQATQLVVVHLSPPSTFCSVAMPRLAADLTEPGEMPRASAISRSDSPDQ